MNEELKQLVSESIKTLGLGVREIYGEKLYDIIEDVRVIMKSARAEEKDVVLEILNKTYKNFEKYNTEDLHMIAKSFSLMLELINACEAAYRIYRLEQKPKTIMSSQLPEELIFVFTGHPTEARSKSFMLIMDKIEKLLLVSLETDFSSIQLRLSYLLKIGLKISLANNKRPVVKDEAEHIIHIVLNKNIIQTQVSLKHQKISTVFRTWVGGDKDGHPKVNSQTMKDCLTLSRRKIIEFAKDKLDIFIDEIKTTAEKELITLSTEFRKHMLSMLQVKEGDGKKVAKFIKLLDGLMKKDKAAKISSPELAELVILLELYPALVLTLEVREDSELIHTALKNKKQTIAQMLIFLKRISQGHDPRAYVRGFVISMCQEARDLLAAAELIRMCTGDYNIPAVPLFENEKGLKNGQEILTKAFKAFPFYKMHKEKWNSKLEVMLGYSDSTKESGVLPGRLLVEEALYILDTYLIDQKFTPVFFHGSGGSITRGGGPIKDQISWWPKSALNYYKVTIQGEMVHRQFHHSSIMRSQIEKIVNLFGDYKQHEIENSPIVEKLSHSIQTAYQGLVNDGEFHHLVSKVTPYHYLDLLKIGSRPTKRSKPGQFSLRAIPWVLCWTQTRLLLPFWWGVGSSWNEISDNDKKQFINQSTKSPLLQTYIKNLGFTLAKVEMGVWKFHLENSTLEDDKKISWDKKINDEYSLVLKFFKDVTSGEDFTWFSPMLGESITYRSSMIHPLNIIQKISLERNDQILLRETVTGIACGMLTTG